MSVVLARIDQRLIHGITVNQWNRVLHPKRFMVVDDLISQDEMVKSSMRMSKPAGTGMSIIDCETAINNFKSGKYDSHSVFLICKEPITILRLIQGGVEIPEVNVGALFEEEGRVPFTKRVALNEEEIKDLKQISAAGIPVFFQYTPDDDERISFEDVLKKKGEK
ncbi:PTS sugar transporter subunit IIB [Xylocopilactobacillus apis]|uniref:PTS mannose transporter subunit IIC n=1 Tax=Xylocopilactobacillus apis TaxID=2932183 RepID=A0AAU9CXD3_9LACO|nr:PTS sugar transporter subunit IIB [Xylocopilactobacillus apis]BDR57066.1 PTS mannose transporter subunit IIC [Xylocopilactobacillus apis]